MELIVADTGPLNYLIEIGCVSVLEHLFAKVIVPEAVRAELAAAGAPAAVRSWIQMPPSWVRIEQCRSAIFRGALDAGEAEAISLALEFGVTLVLMDDADGRETALRLGLAPIGTLGLLEKADEKALLHYGQAVEALKRTSFRASTKLFNLIAERVEARRRESR